MIIQAHWLKHLLSFGKSACPFIWTKRVSIPFTNGCFVPLGQWLHRRTFLSHPWVFTVSLLSPFRKMRGPPFEQTEFSRAPFEDALWQAWIGRFFFKLAKAFSRFRLNLPLGKEGPWKRTRPFIINKIEPWDVLC